MSKKGSTDDMEKQRKQPTLIEDNLSMKVLAPSNGIAPLTITSPHNKGQELTLNLATTPVLKLNTIIDEGEKEFCMQTASSTSSNINYVNKYNIFQSSPLETLASLIVQNNSISRELKEIILQNYSGSLNELANLVVEKWGDEINASLLDEIFNLTLSQPQIVSNPEKPQLNDMEIEENVISIKNRFTIELYQKIIDNEINLKDIISRNINFDYESLINLVDLLKDEDLRNNKNILEYFIDQLSIITINQSPTVSISKDPIEGDEKASNHAEFVTTTSRKVEKKEIVLSHAIKAEDNFAIATKVDITTLWEAIVNNRFLDENIESRINNLDYTELLNLRAQLFDKQFTNKKDILYYLNNRLIFSENGEKIHNKVDLITMTTPLAPQYQTSSTFSEKETGKNPPLTQKISLSTIYQTIINEKNSLKDIKSLILGLNQEILLNLREQLSDEEFRNKKDILEYFSDRLSDFQSNHSSAFKINQNSKVIISPYHFEEPGKRENNTTFVTTTSHGTENKQKSKITSEIDIVTFIENMAANNPLREEDIVSLKELPQEAATLGIEYLCGIEITKSYEEILNILLEPYTSNLYPN